MESAVTVQKSGDGYRIVKVVPSISPSFIDRMEIQVSKSLLRSVMVTEADHLFLVVGKEPKTGNHVVALSETQGSRIDVPPSWILRCGKSEEQAIQSMLSLYIHFLAQSLVKKVLPGRTLAVLDPDFSLAEVLTKYATLRGIQLVLFTTRDSSCSWPWVHIHRHTTRRALTKIIPRNTECLFNVCSDDAIVSNLKESLPSHCRIDTEQSLTVETAQYSPIVAGMEQVVSQLQGVWARVQSDPTPVNVQRIPDIGLGDLIQTQPQLIPQSLITWGSQELPLQVFPATKLVQFAKDKTYWLVGLTGGLGLSLCQWMAQQGARYIALSSRKPKIDVDWIREMAANGCTVRIFAK